MKNNLTTQERHTDALARYHAALHAMQSGVLAEITHDERVNVPINSRDTGPKHLRVGVNSAMVTDAALARLLMDKGIITELEYVEALALAAEAERTRYETHLTKLYGAKITLG